MERLDIDELKTAISVVYDQAFQTEENAKEEIFCFLIYFTGVDFVAY